MQTDDGAGAGTMGDGALLDGEVRSTESLCAPPAAASDGDYLLDECVWLRRLRR